MITHASVYDRPSADGGGFRVLVMRYWPRGVKRSAVDLWLKDAAPTQELVHAYTHDGLPWDEFARRYRAEMLEQRPMVLQQLRALEREHGRLMLLCHERIPPRDHCHREVLAELLAGSSELQPT
ncbi:MAG: DUF488 family protein [Chloroflexota bacterium]|nr:DUF488 family protein [Chloroflexota bacterium]